MSDCRAITDMAKQVEIGRGLPYSTVGGETSVHPSSAGGHLLGLFSSAVYRAGILSENLSL